MPKRTLKTCIEHLDHHQSRHHSQVKNPSLWQKVFQNFHPSIQLHTPAYPPICLMLQVLYINHHERNICLLHHHSHPWEHLSACPRVCDCLLTSPYRLLLVPIAITLVTNLQSSASRQPSLFEGIDFCYPHNLYHDQP